MHFWSVDSYYIILQLQYGLCGLWSFIFLIAAVMLPLLRAAWNQRNPATDPMASAMVGAIGSIVVLLGSVAILNDMRIPWMFHGGLCCQPGTDCPTVSALPGELGTVSACPAAVGCGLGNGGTVEPAGSTFGKDQFRIIRNTHQT